MFPSILVFMSVFGVIFVVILAIYHWKILYLGQTTNENLKKLYKRSSNPFDKGFIANILNLFKFHQLRWEPTKQIVEQR